MYKQLLVLFLLLFLNTRITQAQSCFEPFNRTTAAANGWTKMTACDDCFVPVAFNFNFRGTLFNTVYISSNGALSFALGLSTYSSTPFPAGLGTPIVAPFWADVDLRSGSTYGNLWYKTFSDRLVVRWDSVSHYPTSAIRNTFEVTLWNNTLPNYQLRDATFAYGALTWTVGTATPADTPARAGWDDNAGTYDNYLAITPANMATYANTCHNLFINDRPTKIFVDSTYGQDTFTGTSWTQAFKTLAKALAYAHAPGSLVDSILVARGTYYPTGLQSATDRDSAFHILRGDLKLLGAYPAGGGTRNYALNPVYLDGNISNASMATDNSYHVMVIAGLSAMLDTVLIDGFTFRNGYANGSGNKTYNGQTISQGIGGGIVCYGNLMGAKLQILNCRIEHNIADEEGGGMANYAGSAPLIINCLFAGNTADRGAGLFNHSSSPYIYNTTLSGNRATSSGGGIGNESSSDPTIKNSIVYGNNTGIANSSSSPVVSYSIVQDAYSSSSDNLDIDPLFVSAPSHTSAPFGEPYDYRLQFCSPALNNGDTTGISTAIGTTDLSNAPRFRTVIDRGAYEKQSDVSMGNWGNNIALSDSSSNSLTFLTCSCEDGDWTYYAVPLQPDSLSFAIKWAAADSLVKTAAKIYLNVDTNHRLATNGTTKALVTMKRYWNVDLAGASLTVPVDVRFFYNATDTLGMQSLISGSGVGLPNPLKWFKTTGALFDPSMVTDSTINNGNYVLLNPISYGTSNGIQYAQFDGISSFSGGTAAMEAGSTALPLKLLNFKAVASTDGQSVLVTWDVALEQLDRYHVLRSLNGHSFDTIHIAPAKGQSNYSFKDQLNNLFLGQPLQLFYKLAMREYDGSSSYSSVATVHLGKSNSSSVEILPNPANKQVRLYITDQRLLGEEALITDMLGKTIQHVVLDNNLSIDIQNWQSGIYLLKLTDGSIKKIVKE